MAATLPLDGDGDITQNTDNPTDGLYKLADRTDDGDGYRLSIEGSSPSPLWTDNMGGSIALQPGVATDAGGSQGFVEIDGGVTVMSNTGPTIIVVPPPTEDPPTDTLNIQNAIDAFNQFNRGTVVLQNGTYFISHQGNYHGQIYGILMRDGVVLKGVSKTGTTLRATESDLAVIMWEDTTPNPAMLQSEVSCLHIAQERRILPQPQITGVIGIFLGNLAQPFPPAPADPDFSSVPFAIVNDIFIDGVDIGIQACTWKSTIKECFIQNCNSGIRLEFKWCVSTIPDYGYNFTNSTTVSNCMIANCGTGVYIRGASNIVTNSNIRIGADCYGIYIDNPDNAPYKYANKITNNYIERNDTPVNNVTGIMVLSDANVIAYNFFDLAGEGSHEYVFGYPTTQGKNILTGNYNGVDILPITDYHVTYDDICNSTVTLPIGTTRVLVDIDIWNPLTLILPPLSSYPADAKVEIIVGNLSFNPALSPEEPNPAAYILIQADNADRIRAKNVAITTANPQVPVPILGPNRTVTLRSSGIRSINSHDYSVDPVQYPTWLSEQNDDGAGDAVAVLLQNGYIENMIYTASQADLDYGFTIPDGVKIVLIPDYIGEYADASMSQLAPDIFILFPSQYMYNASTDYVVIINNSPLYRNVIVGVSASCDFFEGEFNGMRPILNHRKSVAVFHPQHPVVNGYWGGLNYSWASV